MLLQPFDAYRLASARGYAEENVASGRWPIDSAFERALEDFDQSLPKGLDTPDNYIYEIRDEADGATVGFIWFAVIEKNGIRSAFVYDVVVDAKHQRRGHARSAF
jgi:ribosomal protein S18 acetylase RimI-like enzyme